MAVIISELSLRDERWELLLWEWLWEKSQSHRWACQWEINELLPELHRLSISVSRNTKNIMVHLLLNTKKFLKTKLLFVWEIVKVKRQQQYTKCGISSKLVICIHVIIINVSHVFVMIFTFRVLAETLFFSYIFSHLTSFLTFEHNKNLFSRPTVQQCSINIHKSQHFVGVIAEWHSDTATQRCMHFQEQEATFLCVPPEIMMPLTSFRGVMWICGMETPLVLHLGDHSEFLLTSDPGGTILICLIILVLSSFHAFDVQAHPALIGHRQHQGVRQSKSIRYLWPIRGCAAILNMSTGVYISTFGQTQCVWHCYSKISYSQHWHALEASWPIDLFCQNDSLKCGLIVELWWRSYKRLMALPSD